MLGGRHCVGLLEAVRFTIIIAFFAIRIVFKCIVLQVTLRQKHKKRGILEFSKHISMDVFVIFFHCLFLNTLSILQFVPHFIAPKKRQFHVTCFHVLLTPPYFLLQVQKFFVFEPLTVFCPVSSFTQLRINSPLKNWHFPFSEGGEELGMLKNIFFHGLWSAKFG